jgi:hypothetical protein
LVKLFQKLAGLGRAHKTAFLFAKPFSLRLVCQRKSGLEIVAFSIISTVNHPKSTTYAI